MMMAVSDNAATDILIGLAGLDSINATLASLGLHATVIPGTEQAELDSIGQDAGYAGWNDLIRASARFTAEEDRRIQDGFLRARALTPEHAIRTTAREMATLLRLIWRDEAGPAQVPAPHDLAGLRGTLFGLLGRVVMDSRPPLEEADGDRGTPVNADRRAQRGTRPFAGPEPPFHGVSRDLLPVLGCHEDLRLRCRKLSDEHAPPCRLPGNAEPLCCDCGPYLAAVRDNWRMLMPAGAGVV
jgi:Beta-lactamase enzyme family